MLFVDGRVMVEGLQGLQVARRRRRTLCDDERGASGDTAREGEVLGMLPSDESGSEDDETAADDVAVDRAWKQVLEVEVAQRENMQRET